MEMEEILENLDKELDKLLSGDNFEPAKRDIDKQVVVKASKHIAITSNGDNLDELTKPAIEKDDQDDDLKIYLQELDDLIGLKNVKDEITSLISTVAINKKREEMGLKVPDFSNHLVFFGNPGTGKTSVARILAKVYKALGFLSKGQLIEKDRAGLVAGYVGQTAIKTKEVINSALGGILFIDEAYTLAPEGITNDFGQEAIDTLLKAMEDHRDDFIVIVAGYPQLMAHFIDSNPGLKSRFNKYIYFEDYSAEELREIFLLMCKNNQYIVSDDLSEILLPYFENIVSNKPDNFANAREVRNLFEKTVQKQSIRLFLMKHPSKEDVQTLTKEDFPVEL